MKAAEQIMADEAVMRRSIATLQKVWGDRHARNLITVGNFLWGKLGHHRDTILNVRRHGVRRGDSASFILAAYMMATGRYK